MFRDGAEASVLDLNGSAEPAEILSEEDAFAVGHRRDMTDAFGVEIEGIEGRQRFARDMEGGESVARAGVKVVAVGRKRLIERVRDGKLRQDGEDPCRGIKV